MIHKDFISISKPAALATWRIYLILAIVQGLAALALLLQTQSAAEAAFLLGFSRTRLMITLGVVIALGILAWLLIETWIRRTRTDQRIEVLLGMKPAKWTAALLLTGLLFLAGSYFITLLPEIQEPFTLGIFERITPLVIWMTGLCIQTLTALLILRHGHETIHSTLDALRPTDSGKRSFYISTLVIGIIFLVWSWVASQMLAQEAPLPGWNDMGAPILETQVLLAWAAGMVMLFLLLNMPTRQEPSNSLTGGKWLSILRLLQKRFSLARLSPQRIDLLVGLLLWLGTIVLWQNIPITPNWFISEPRSPNFEYYPNSDARTYDMVAQSALAGEGYIFFGLPYIRRPLLAMFMLVLHMIAGQDYASVIFAQIVILALFPPLIYLLTRSIHNRVSGVIAAVLLMLREANSIAIAGRVTTSNAKALLADLPVALVIAGFMLLAFLWMTSEQSPTGNDGLHHKPAAKTKFSAAALRPLLAGGALGMAMLIRQETFILYLGLAGILALILWPRKRHTVPQHFRLWITGMLTFTLGLVLVLTPWVWRNWNLTGKIFLDSPLLFRMDLIALRYRPADQVNQQPVLAATPSPLPTTISVATPVSAATPSSSETAPTPTPISATPATPTGSATPATYEQLVGNYVKENTTNFIKDNLDKIFRFVLANYENSQVQSFLILPTSWRALDSLTAFLGHHETDTLWQECCSTLNYLRRMPYWHSWNGRFLSQSALPLIVNVLLIALGTSQAWKKYRWAGLSPWMLSAAYMLANAMFRNSGGRYILAIDWVSVLYYSMGLAHISTATVRYLTNDNHANLDILRYTENNGSTAGAPNASQASPSRMQYALAVTLFVLGCLIPLVEHVYASPYAALASDQQGRTVSAWQNARLKTLTQSNLLSDTQRQDLNKFLMSGGAMLSGRALYPIYYPANTGDPGTGNPMGPKPYPRLAFHLVSPKELIPSVTATIKIPMIKGATAEQGPLASFPSGSDVLVFACPDRQVLAVAVFGKQNEANSDAPTAIFWRTPLPGNAQPITPTCPLPPVEAASSSAQPSENQP